VGLAHFHRDYHPTPGAKYEPSLRGAEYSHHGARSVVLGGVGPRVFVIQTANRRTESVT
jgi:hypothetical protein